MRLAVAQAPLLALLVASPSAALAGTGVVAWSTYLRAGPTQTSAAVAEVEHDRRVQVLACGGAWCRIRDEEGTEGFVDRAALALPRTRAPAPPAASNCVTAALTDNRKPMPTRFCTGALQAR